MLKFGVASCFGGFGEWTFVKDGTCEYDGDFAHGAARPQVKPSSEQSSAAVVAELSTLLTAGRLSPANREIVRLAYDGLRQTLPEWIDGLCMDLQYVTFILSLPLSVLILKYVIFMNICLCIDIKTCHLHIYIYICLY